MFFRTLVLLLLALVVLTFIRMFAGILTKSVGGMFENKPNPNAPPRPPAAAGGELKRDPVCGTFVAPGTAVTKNVRGEVVHFCSTACRDKYQG